MSWEKFLKINGVLVAISLSEIGAEVFLGSLVGGFITTDFHSLYGPPPVFFLLSASDSLQLFYLLAYFYPVIESSY